MKSIVTSIIVAILIIVGAIYVSKNNQSGGLDNDAQVNNVSIIDGKQIVEIQAKGGYLPRKSTAKSGIPTVIRFNTNGTFDCSASVRIPSLGIGKLLPYSGNTDIDIGINKSGILRGSCGMGMYPFEIEFQG